MAAALISAAVEKLTSIAQEVLGGVVGVTEEIDKLSSSFTAIQTVLNDAESRQIKDGYVRYWLRKLKDVAYDGDDLLDGWRTEALRSQINEGEGFRIGNKKVRIDWFNQVALRLDIGCKIRKLRERLDAISRENDNYFKFRLDQDRSIHVIERQTSSLINEKEIFGREQDKETIVSLLVGESSQERARVPIISIIGMGGLGKTTLAQQAFNDNKVENHFNMRLWVCVWEDFDVIRLTKEIIENAKVNPHGSQLDTLQQNLCDVLNGKRFLLVLDDVWEENEDKCDKLKLPLQRGAPGSRFIVTTRNVNVATATGTTHQHSLGVLPEEDCWSLFSHKAFYDRIEEERLMLEETGRAILKKCKGVPLAAKVIGSVMRSKRIKRDWDRVLESDIWGLQVVGKGIYPALLLSYYNLPPNLKQCFAYCSLFPKDYRKLYGGNRWGIFQ